MPELRRPGLPVDGPATVERPGARLLRERGGRRPVVVVRAAPGWGASTAAAGWSETMGAACLTVTSRHRDLARLTADLARCLGVPVPPEASAERLLAAWRESGPRALVLDRVDLLRGWPGAVLVDAVLAQRPQGARVLLISRHPDDPAPATDAAAGQVLHLDATHLGLDAVAVAAVLAEEGAPDEVLAARIADRTGGWPAAVRLLVDGLLDVDVDHRSERLETLAGAAGPVSRYLLEVAFPALSDLLLRSLTQVAMLGTADPDRFATVAGIPVHRGEETLESLVRLGLVRRVPGARGRVRPAPVVASTVLERYLPERADAAELIAATVERLVGRGEVVAAIAVVSRTGRDDQLAALLREHGAGLLHGGRLEELHDAVLAVPATARDRDLWLLLAHAAGYLGRWDTATTALGALEVTTTGGTLDPEVALAAGVVAHLRGQPSQALVAYARAGEGDGAIEAELAGWRSTAHWLIGEVEAARPLAAAVLCAASELRDDRLLALAHIASTLVAASEGDRAANERHYEQALAAARRAGDELQEARILTNRGSLHLEEGRFEAARVETEAAIDLAEAQRSVQIGAIARCNRAEILLRLGWLDEAIADAEEARDRFAAIGSKHESYAHHLLGDARRERGELALARRAYERSLALSEPVGDRQGRVPALIGMVRTLAGSDPDRALRMADRALELDDGMYRATALLAFGWASLAGGDPATARVRAAEAEAEATRRGDRTALAEAATLGALLADDPRPGLSDAASQWRDLDARMSAARVELGLLRRSDRPADRTRAGVVEERLRAWGCAIDHGAFAHVAVLGTSDHPRCAVRVLGEFAVERDGQPVAASSWGSRKARDLLKFLVSRSSRGATREELADVLWPDEPYDTVANRLSVALSVVRGVLTPDDAERDDSAIVTDGAAVRLEVDRVDVDLERFERLAEAGLTAAREEREGARSRELLDSAEKAYGGDLLEHDHDSPWLVDRREQLRATYVTVARTLADLVVTDDPDRAVQLLLRVLDRDAYDEPAHLAVCTALVRAGRHGEARRRHRLYARRMEELELPSRPFEQLGKVRWSAAGQRAATA